MRSPIPQAHILVFNVQTTWLSLLALVIEVAALAWYLPATRRSAARGRPWPLLKTASFVLAVLVAAYTIEGGIAHYSRSNFTLNAVRCLLLFDLVPPLLALGSPLTLVLRSSPKNVSEGLLRVLGSPLSRAVAHPVAGVLVLQAVLYIYFLTPLYSLAERHSPLEALMELLLVATGCLYWWPIVGGDATPRPLSYPARFVMVFASVPLTIALGASISSVTKPLYAVANTLHDTHTGGQVLWQLAQVFIVLVLSLLFVSLAADEERKARLADRQLDAALAAAREPSPDAG